jgi:transcriptional regulator with XRE-family HTH domain
MILQFRRMSSIGDRIKQRREHLTLTQEQVGRHLDVSREAVAQWERNETTPRGKRLRELRELLQCSMQWLLEGEASIFEMPEQAITTTVIPQGYVAVSYITSRAGAGGGRIVMDDYLGTPKYYEEDLIRRELRGRPEDFRVIEIEGPSMEPLLQNRDQVLFDTRKTSIVEPGLFVVDDGEGIVCKWVERAHGTDPARIRLKSENQRFDPYEVEAERASILGRVVWFARRL